MIGRFISGLRAKQDAAPPRPASAPADTRVYAIGDIHGRADLLEDMIKLIRGDAARHGGGRRVAVFLGDYVDRGLESRQVIDVLLGDPLPGFETIHLLGNHEHTMLEFLEDTTIGPAWLTYGGRETLYSYGVLLDRQLDEAARLSKAQADLRARLPASHRDFLRGLAASHVEGDYAFVHAGIRPARPIEQQELSDLIWIRDEFLRSKADHGRIIVHGHSISDQPEERANRIGIDTGAYATGRLTCLVLAGTTRHFMQTKTLPGL
jgi:serine/threonine protein phosphatase 1